MVGEAASEGEVGEGLSRETPGSSVSCGLSLLCRFEWHLNEVSLPHRFPSLAPSKLQLRSLNRKVAIMEVTLH